MSTSLTNIFSWFNAYLSLLFSSFNFSIGSKTYNIGFIFVMVLIFGKLINSILSIPRALPSHIISKFGNDTSKVNNQVESESHFGGYTGIHYDNKLGKWTGGVHFSAADELKYEDQDIDALKRNQFLSR